MHDDIIAVSEKTVHFFKNNGIRHIFCSICWKYCSARVLVCFMYYSYKGCGYRDGKAEGLANEPAQNLPREECRRQGKFLVGERVASANPGMHPSAFRIAVRTRQ